jgi:hypothetical protein
MIEISSVTAFCLSILRGNICVVEAKYSKKNVNGERTAKC